MKEKIRQKIQLGKNGGLTDEEYESIKGPICQKNREVLVSVSAFAMILQMVLFVASFLVASLETNRELYGIFLGFTIVIFILSQTVLKKKEALILPVFYFFLVLAYAYGIILGGFLQTEIPATTFAVLLFALPLLVTDRPYRISIFLCVVSLVFVIVSTKMKTPEIASLDRVNTISFLFMGIAVNLIIMKTKLSELAGRIHIERERDTDDLTKLMTKASTARNIREYIEKTQEMAALLVIDIDNFKGINDKLGHAYGDAVLRIMGECIHESFRKGDILGRFGGDEFVIFLPSVRDEYIVKSRVETLVTHMNNRLTMPENAIQVTGSIGIAFYPQHAMTYEELFEKADQALYCSKEKGKNCYTFYLDKDLRI